MSNFKLTAVWQRYMWLFTTNSKLQLTERILDSFNWNYLHQDKTITKFELGNFDYISTEHPPTLPQGYAVEVFSLETLENSWQNAKKNSEREHVSPYM